MKIQPPATLSLLLLLAGCGGPYQPSAWLATVPAQAHQQLDPLPQSAVNVSEGHDTYSLYCSGCHNTGGQGRRGRPSLRTARVHTESDGDIHWILVNGSKNHGMPAWRSLGDPDLWQLVQYIRSLPLAPQK